MKANLALKRVLLIHAGLFLMLAVVSACEDSPRPECAFNSGEMVRSRVSGQTGQVTWRSNQYNRNHCYYHVRFAARQAQTQVRLLGLDGAIAERPLALVKHMREYELEKVK